MPKLFYKQIFVFAMWQSIVRLELLPGVYSVLYLIADHPELHAQVSAQVPLGPRQRHPPAALLHLQDVRLQRVPVHWRDGLSK